MYYKSIVFAAFLDHETAKFYTRQITFRGTTKVVYMGPAKLVYMGHTKFVYMGATKFVYMGRTKVVYMGHTKLVYMGHTKLDSCRRTRKFHPSSCISKRRANYFRIFF